MSHQELASWIFGSLSFVFVIVVFWLSPNDLPPHKVRVLALVSALLSGLFAYFFTGSLSIMAQGSLPHLGKVAIQGGGGMAMFLVVLRWWRSPHGPIKQMAPDAAAALENSAYESLPMYRNSDAHNRKLRGALNLSFDGLMAEKHWEEAVNAYKDQDYEGTVTLCNKALELDPDLGPVKLVRGLAFMQLKTPAEALKDFNAVLAIVPDYGLALKARLNAAGLVGDYETARRDAETLEKLGDSRPKRQLERILKQSGR